MLAERNQRSRGPEQKAWLSEPYTGAVEMERMRRVVTGEVPRPLKNVQEELSL